jgi:predicted nucleotidyltransferase
MSELELLDIKKKLKEKSLNEKLNKEKIRQNLIVHVIDTLKKYFSDYPGCNVYLTGSIVRPGLFSDSSDIDIAVENFKGSRLDLFMELSELFDIPIDLIIMERCHFSEHIRDRGIVVCFSGNYP